MDYRLFFIDYLLLVLILIHYLLIIFLCFIIWCFFSILYVVTLV